jgi:hypothetical protein
MAKAAFDAGDFAQCIDLAAQAGSPNDAETDRAVALAYLRLGRLDEAVARLDLLLSTGDADAEDLKLERGRAAGQLCLLKADAANEVRARAL